MALAVDMFIAAYEVFIGEYKLPIDRDKVAKHKVTFRALTREMNEPLDVIAFNVMLNTLEAAAEKGDLEDLRAFKFTVGELKSLLKLAKGCADHEEVKVTTRSVRPSLS